MCIRDRQGLRKSQAVSWRLLDDEIGRLASSLLQASARAIGIEQRLPELSEQAAILADAVHQTVLEESDQTGADLQFWADAVGACIESHRRDLSATRTALLEARLKSLAEAA